MHADPSIISIFYRHSCPGDNIDFRNAPSRPHHPFYPSFTFVIPRFPAGHLAPLPYFPQRLKAEIWINRLEYVTPVGSKPHQLQSIWTTGGQSPCGGAKALVALADVVAVARRKHLSLEEVVLAAWSARPPASAKAGKPTT